MKSREKHKRSKFQISKGVGNSTLKELANKIAQKKLPWLDTQADVSYGDDSPEKSWSSRLKA